MPARHRQRLNAIDYPIDAATPSCFNIRKALLTKRRWFNGSVSCVAVNTTFLLLTLTHHRNSIANRRILSPRKQTALSARTYDDSIYLNRTIGTRRDRCRWRSMPTINAEKAVHEYQLSLRRRQ